VSDSDVVGGVLKALENALNVAEELCSKTRKEHSQIRPNQIAVRIREADGVKMLEELRHHECDCVRELAVELIETYFLDPTKKRLAKRRRER
jgi:Atypical Arm repeat